MLAAQIVSFVLVTGIILSLYFVLKSKKINFLNIFLKTLSLILATVFFFMFMSGDEYLRYTFALNSHLRNQLSTLIALILNWTLDAAVLLVILFPFFKSTKSATLIKTFGLLVAVLNFMFIAIVSQGVFGSNAYSGFSFRTLLFGMVLGVLFAECLVVFFEYGKFKIAKKDATVFLYIIGMLIATVPTYILQALFGYAAYPIAPIDLSFPHRVILYMALIIPFVIYVLLRHKNVEIIRGILLYISLGTLLSFSIKFRFADFMQITNWPLHLCNTAMYIIPLCLMFKWNKVFYFTYFINVFGAFIAMAIPNYSSHANIFSDSILLFYVNHYIAFFMPILMVALNVYERPKLRQFIYSMFGFGIYFVLVLFFNAWFSNYGSVDYFFINSDFVADKLGTWAENLRNITWSFKINGLSFVFYPLYQFLFFLVYGLIAAAMWFLYEACYGFADTVLDIMARKEKINVDRLALEVAKSQNKRSTMGKEEISIVLNNFTKRYGKSNVYAVKDANMVVKGGQVFGFLGHNGAGKSTIIKSIVGIQPITEGSITVCGYDVEHEPVEVKRNIGFVPDQYALYEKLTGRQYINYIADLYNVSEEDRNKSIDKYVKLFELENAFDNQIKTYSHGMKQKITIMSALVHNPKVWILDEPLTGLDPESIFQVKQCMKQHAKAGNVVFFSSHLIDIVEQICDHVAIIKRGKILTSQNMDEIRKHGTLEQFFLEATKTKVNQVEVKNTDSVVIEQQKTSAEKSQKNKKRVKSKAVVS